MKPYKNPTAKQIRIVTEQATKWKEAGDSAERKRNFNYKWQDLDCILSFKKNNLSVDVNFSFATK